MRHALLISAALALLPVHAHAGTAAKSGEVVHCWIHQSNFYTTARRCNGLIALNEADVKKHWYVHGEAGVAACAAWVKSRHLSTGPAAYNLCARTLDYDLARCAARPWEYGKLATTCIAEKNGLPLPQSTH